MNINNWKPVLYSTDFSGKKVPGGLNPCMCFEAKVVCPCCRTAKDFRTSGHTLSGPLKPDLSRNTQWELDGLIKPRECEACGVVFSPIPKAGREAFSAEVYAMVTDEWRDKEIEKLKNEKVKEDVSG